MIFADKLTPGDIGGDVTGYQVGGGRRHAVGDGGHAPGSRLARDPAQLAHQSADQLRLGCTLTLHHRVAAIRHTPSTTNAEILANTVAIELISTTK